MEEFFRLKKPVVIWGMGARGKALYKVLGHENVAAFIENDKNVRRQNELEKPAMSFEEYKEKEYRKLPIVVSALFFEKEIEMQIRESGDFCYFLLSEECSELQGHGEKGFFRKIPLPSDKTGQYIIVGSNLFACICYEWYHYNGYHNTFLWSDNDERRRIIKNKLDYSLQEDVDGKADVTYYIASREPFEKKIPANSVVDLFDLSIYDKSNDNERLLKFFNTYNGEACFVIGNGPSLSINDVRRITVRTFGVNRIYLLSTQWTPDFYLCTDAKVLEDNSIYSYNAKHKFFSEKVKDVIGESDEYINVSHVLASNNNTDIPFSEDIAHVVYSGGNVVYAALQLAVYMGFKEIYLLGVDCDYPKNAPSHFYGDDFDAGGDPEYYRSVIAFESARRYADSHGIKIYNATRGGKLEVFERVGFDTLDFVKDE